MLGIGKKEFRQITSKVGRAVLELFFLTALLGAVTVVKISMNQ
jgi:hypothetical protein